MLDLLRQLYNAKMLLVGVSLVAAGTVAFIVGNQGGPSWLKDLGQSGISTGLLSVILQLYIDHVSERRTAELVRGAIHQEVPAIREAVLDSLSFKVDTLKSVASPETLDRLTVNALGLRLGDERMARELYADLQQQLGSTPERWRDMDVSISLRPWGRDKPGSQHPMFEATVRWEYRVIPASPVLRFACVSDLNDYRRLLNDPTVASVSYFEPVAGLDGASAEAFAVERLAVDGVERPVRRATRKQTQTCTADLGVTAGQEVVLAYSYRVLVQQRGNVMSLNTNQPCHNLRIHLDYDGTGIKHVTTLDFIAGAKQTRIERTDSAASAASVDIGFDGWVFARSGVAFVWVKDDKTLSHRAAKTKQVAPNGRTSYSERPKAGSRA